MNIGSRYSIVRGDVLEVLKLLPDNSFDALLCDPPYGFSFMGKAWDYDVPSVAVWAEALRVLKPGAPLLAFGGSRTYHRMACNIEDAGFELRDCLHWLYSKGFPKSQNIGLALDKAAGATRSVVGTRVLTGNAAISTKEKGGTYGIQVGSIPPKEVPVTAPATELAQQWDGYGTALKPAYEPIVLARKPLIGTMAENVVAWDVGGLAIDACRIGNAGGTCKPKDFAPQDSKNTYGNGLNSVGAFKVEQLDAGRWPANLLLDEESAAMLDESVPPTKSIPFGKGKARNEDNHATGAVLPLSRRTAGGYDEPAGGPSRFFYCAKVSTRERELGCDALPRRSAGEMTEREEGSEGLDNPRAGAGRTGGARNHHPTLKPISLTTWLASLIKPPTSGAKLLVPYSGAGSEMIGALKAGWPLVLGIESDAEYVAIANARIVAHVKE